MEEGFILDIYKKFIKLSDLNPLLLYDMTIFELITFLEVRDVESREDLETEANVMRIAINSAMSGKPLKLFEENAPKIKKGSVKNREEEFKALDDMGL